MSSRYQQETDGPSNDYDRQFNWQRQIPEGYRPPCIKEGVALCDLCLEKEQPTCSGGRPVHAEAVGDVSGENGGFETKDMQHIGLATQATVEHIMNNSRYGGTPVERRQYAQRFRSGGHHPGD